MPQGAVIWDYSRPVTHTHVAVLPMAMGGAGDVSIAISIAWHTSQLPSHHREHIGFYYFTWTLVENFGSPTSAPSEIQDQSGIPESWKETNLPVQSRHRWKGFFPLQNPPWDFTD